MMEIRYLGHSCFLISGQGQTILIDPFLTGNPTAAEPANKIKPDLILLTHGHGDHLGDAISISKKTDAELLGVFELMNYCEKHGAKNAHRAHMGAKIPYEFGWVKIVPAFHSSSTPDGEYAGNPVGFVINYHGHHIYHAGDTCIYGDMALIGRLYGVDTALLPIGSTFTMDVNDATESVKLLGCKTAIPMHYNTFPGIESDPNEFKREVESSTNAKVIILEPGQSTTMQATREKSGAIV